MRQGCYSSHDEGGTICFHLLIFNLVVASPKKSRTALYVKLRFSLRLGLDLHELCKLLQARTLHAGTGKTLELIKDDAGLQLFGISLHSRNCTYIELWSERLSMATSQSEYDRINPTQVKPAQTTDRTVY